MKILFISLGCDKNLVDTEMMLGQLSQEGFTFTDDEYEAEVIVINTCCFINDAKEESINTILEMAELKKSRPQLDFCNLLLTLGSKGAVYYPKNGGQKIAVPACKVEKVVDTTGAGDTFIGYFTAELAKGLSVEICLAHASAAAANSITKAGAAVSIPFINELGF